MNKHRTALPYLAAVLPSAIFGLSFLFSNLALRVSDVFTLLSFRFLLAFASMSILILLRVIRVDYKGKGIKPLFLLGFLQPVAYFTFEAYGISLSSSSFAGMIIALIPVTICVCSVFFLKERLAALQWVFISLSVLGVLVIVLLGGGGLSFSALGLGSLLLSVVCATAYNMLSRKLSASYTPVELTYFMMGMGATLFTAIAVGKHAIAGSLRSYIEPLANGQFIVSCLYLGLFSSVVAFLSLNYALSKIEASRTSVFGNLCTIVSIVAGVAILHERFEFYHAIGAALIVGGIWGMQSVKRPQAEEQTLAQ